MRAPTASLQQTLRVCDRAYIIDEGKVFAEGTPRELINDEMVRRVYLGSLFRGDEFDQPTHKKRPVVSVNGQHAGVKQAEKRAVRLKQ